MEGPAAAPSYPVEVPGRGLPAKGANTMLRVRGDTEDGRRTKGKGGTDTARPDARDTDEERCTYAVEAMRKGEANEAAPPTPHSVPFTVPRSRLPPAFVLARVRLGTACSALVVLALTAGGESDTHDFPAVSKHRISILDARVTVGCRGARTAGPVAGEATIAGVFRGQRTAVSSYNSVVSVTRQRAVSLDVGGIDQGKRCYR
ncbi:hypothetical protein B0H16DRAFT_1460308 [Mycena metata]|uniref:Uncharacterized protein n=1 Tax=Mycena metata TaxID=1033252 RepID=A0AAD7IWU4_9AGAR|nr:hypothetical protein B0H16DRAFT_1460308 [Mycena metata]